MDLCLSWVQDIYWMETADAALRGDKTYCCHREGMHKPTGRTALWHAELQAVLQLYCTKLWAWEVRAEALNLFGTVTRIMSGRWD